MTETTLRYEMHVGTIGATAYLDALEQVVDAPAELSALQSIVATRGVAILRTHKPFEPAQLAAFERYFGVSASRGKSHMLLAGSDFVDDYSIAPKVDDGRARRVAPTDFIHIDTMTNGPAAFGVHATLSGASVVPMRFADMRAVYSALPDAMQRKLVGLQARHSVPHSVDGKPPASTLQPLAALHPRTHAPLALLPNRGACHIEGMSDDEATQLIYELWRTTEEHPGLLEVPLQPHTLIVWDNIMCTHTNPGFPRGPGRVVWFFNTLNDRAVQAVA